MADACRRVLSQLPLSLYGPGALVELSIVAIAYIVENIYQNLPQWSKSQQTGERIYRPQALNITPVFCSLSDHHTLQIFSGTMLVSFGHWKALANSGKFCNDPRTLNFPGLWTSVLMELTACSGLCVPHQICAKLRKKSCSWLRFIPGRGASFPCFFT